MVLYKTVLNFVDTVTTHVFVKFLKHIHVKTVWKNNSRDYLNHRILNEISLDSQIYIWQLSGKNHGNLHYRRDRINTVVKLDCNGSVDQVKM